MRLKWVSHTFDPEPGVSITVYDAECNGLSLVVRQEGLRKERWQSAPKDPLWSFTIGDGDISEVMLGDTDYPTAEACMAAAEKSLTDWLADTLAVLRGA